MTRDSGFVAGYDEHDHMIGQPPPLRLPEPVREPPLEAAEHRNGLGIASFCCGIVGAVLGPIPILGYPAVALGATGFGLGLGALARLRKRWADNKVMTWFGVVLSVIAVILGIIGIVIVTHAIDDLNTELNNLNTNV